MGRKIYDEDLRLNLILNGQGLQSGSAKMVAELGKMEMEMVDLENKARQLALSIKNLEKNATANATQLARERTQYTQLTAAIRAHALAIEQQRQKVGMLGMTVQQLRNYMKGLQVQMYNMAGSQAAGTQAFRNLQREIRETQIRLTTLTTGASRFSQAWSRMEQSINKAGTVVGWFAMAIYGVVRIVTNVITRMKELEDLLGTVRKNTQLTTGEVWKLKEAFDQWDTRTSTDDLLKLAVVAGKLGIQGKEDIMKFVDAGNQIQVALGDDLDGTVEETVNSIGKLTNAFRVFTEVNEKTGKKYTLDEAMIATGSVLNDLAKSSAASAGTILNYMTRLSSVGELAGFTIAQIGGIGSTLDAMNVPAERGATAMQKIMLALANPKKIQDFAEAMGLVGNTTETAAEQYEKMLKADPNNVMTTLLRKFVSTKDGLVELTGGLKDFGAKGQYMTAVIGAIAQNLDVLADQQEVATKAWVAQTSVLNEYDIMNNNFTANILKQQKIIRAQTDHMNREAEPAVLRIVTAWASFVKGIRNATDWIGENWQMIKKLTFAYIVLKVPVVWRISALITESYWTQKNLILMRLKNISLMTEIAFTRTLTASQTRLLGMSQLATLAHIAYTKGIREAIVALRAMAVAQYSMPWVAAGIAVAALAGAFYMLVVRKRELSVVEERQLERSKAIKKTIEEEGGSLAMMIERLKDVNISNGERSKIMETLREQYGDYLPLLMKEGITAKEVVGSYEAIVEAMQKKAVWQKSIEDGSKTKGELDAINDKIKAEEQLIAKTKEKMELSARSGKMGSGSVVVSLSTDLGRYEEEFKKLTATKIELTNEWSKLVSDAAAMAPPKPPRITKEVDELEKELERVKKLREDAINSIAATEDTNNELPAMQMKYKRLGEEQTRLEAALGKARVAAALVADESMETFKQRQEGLKQEFADEERAIKQNAYNKGLGEDLQNEKIRDAKIRNIQKQLQDRRDSWRTEDEEQKAYNDLQNELLDLQLAKQREAKKEDDKENKKDDKNNVKDAQEFAKDLIDVEKMRIATITDEREKALAEENLRFEQEIGANWKNDEALEYAEAVHLQNMSDINLKFLDKQLADKMLNQTQRELVLDEAYKKELISEEQYWTIKAQLTKDKETGLHEFKKQYALLSTNELIQLDISELKKSEYYELLSEENKQKAIDGIILKYGRARAKTLKRTLDTELNTIKEGFNAEQQTAYEEGQKQVAIFQNIGDKITGVFEGMFQENQNAMAVFAKEMLMVALDFVKAEIRLQYPLILAKQIASKGPVAGTAAAGTSIALIEAAMAVGFGVAKAFIGKINTAKKTEQKASGSYPVIGADDGRMYDAVDGGNVRTGVYRSPTLLNMSDGRNLVGERAPELVVDGETFRRIQVNAPQLIREVYAWAGRFGYAQRPVPQRASGSYPSPPTEVGGNLSGGNSRRMDTEERLIAAIDRFVKHTEKGIPAYINKYGHNGIDESIAEIAKFNSLTK